MHELLGSEALQRNRGHHDSGTVSPVRCADRDTGIDPMTPSRQQAKAAKSGIRVFSFRQDPPTAGDHGVSREHIGFTHAKPFDHGIALA